METSVVLLISTVLVPYQQGAVHHTAVTRNCFLVRAATPPIEEIPQPQEAVSR